MSERLEILKNIAEAQTSGARRKLACDTAGVDLRTIQRWGKDLRGDGRNNNQFTLSNALSPEERMQVIETACSPEFRDLSPKQIVPILAENGVFIASESTFYRFLRKAGLLTHRSKAKAPTRNRPEEISAEAPNQLWSWDISYLLTLSRGSFLYLYLIMDIWDRSIVGWAVHEVESGKLAADLLNETCVRNGVNKGELTLHQDNGAPMISGEFLAELTHWAQASYSRPGVSDDNPYSESLFRTLKYRPAYPDKFSTIEEAIDWIRTFVEWYNSEHRHSAIGFVTPNERRSGADIAILENRRKTYQAARMIHPERWSGNTRKWERPDKVTLNPRNNKKDRQEVAA